jgi:prevent-host-death family protein
MTRETSAVQSVTISEAATQFPHLIDAVAQNAMRIRIERGGEPVAALVSVADLERLSQFEQEREERFAVVDRMREAFKDVSPDDLEREIVALIREIRVEEDASRWAEDEIAADRRSA